MPRAFFALALLGVRVQSAVGEDVRFRTLNLANLREDGRRALRSSGSDLSLETIEERLKGDGLCPPAEIANSNRNWTSPCNGLKQQGWAPTGTECEYTCDEGYIPIGRHVCQWHNVVQVNGSTGERSVNEAELEPLLGQQRQHHEEAELPQGIGRRGNAAGAVGPV